MSSGNPKKPGRQETVRCANCGQHFLSGGLGAHSMACKWRKKYGWGRVGG